MRYLFPTIAALLLLPFARAGAQEQNLFNGKDLTGWDGLPGVWSVEDGAITGRTTAQGQLDVNTCLIWSGGVVADFELTCQVRISGGNSGIQYRSRPVDPAKFTVGGYQADLEPKSSFTGTLYESSGRNVLGGQGKKTVIDPGGGPMVQATPRLVGALPAMDSVNAAVRSGAWFEYRIVAVGRHLQHFINGIQTTDVTDNSGFGATAGLIAFELHKGPPTNVQFKQIVLKRLQGEPGAPAAPSPAPSSPPAPVLSGQDALETLTRQSPNVIEWVLAPLEQSVPADIRQSVTFLREDLLDEAAQKPKAPPQAYALGSQLCGALLATMEERARARAQAGFRAVEAEARTGVSSQALEARRNYKMSWPQFVREEAQRAELKSQASSSAQVLKERPKLEWVNRSTTLRTALEAQYGQFRAALRQPAAAS
jgi:hypothetical protein